jgi:hypothetical protein
MITAVDQELAQMAAYKSSSSCHQHSVPLAAWLCFHHPSKALLRSLHNVRRGKTVARHRSINLGTLELM